MWPFKSKKPSEPPLVSGFTYKPIEFTPTVLNLGSGDIVVLQTDHHVSRELVARLREEWDKLHKGTRCAVLTGGIQLVAVLKEDK